MKKLVFVFLLLSVIGHTQTYERPFTGDSIWYTKLQDGIESVHATFDTSGALNWMVQDQQIVKTVVNSDPTINAFQKTGPGFDFVYCNAANQTTTVLWNDFKLPNSYVHSTHAAGNGQGIFVQLDHPTIPGRIREGWLVERCSASAPIYFWSWGSTSLDFPPSPGEQNLYTIYSSGHFNIHGSSMNAANMVGLPGIIRSGELTTPAGVYPQHSLRICLPRGKEHYSAGDVTPGYRWPAKSPDSGANTTYVGTVPDCKMGTLLFVPKSVSAESLGIITELAKKLLRTLQEYGGYVIDSFGGVETWGMLTQIESASNLTVANETMATWNIHLDNMFQDHHSYTTEENNFFNNDMPKIMDVARCVSNNSRYWPKGPPIGTVMKTKNLALDVMKSGEPLKLKSMWWEKNPTRE